VVRVQRQQADLEALSRQLERAHQALREVSGLLDDEAVEHSGYDLATQGDRLARYIVEMRSVRRLLVSKAVRVGTLEDEVKQLREAQRWIPVTERLPEVGEKVQVVTVRPDGSRDIINDRYIGRGRWRLHDALGHRATHWRSLPPLPEEVSA
jgi:hypothetical protein